jgi:hypothetical protein
MTRQVTSNFTAQANPSENDRSASDQNPLTSPETDLKFTDSLAEVNTKLYNQHLSWRSICMRSAESKGAKRLPSDGQLGCSKPLPGFAEIMRRRQIADLLSPVSVAPHDSRLIHSPVQAQPATIPVRLAYPDEERPLPGFRSLRPATV